MLDENCPKCGAMFPADRAWANRSLSWALLSPALQELDTRVKCPRCALVFDSSEYRFFGFVKPRVMRIGLGLFVATMVIFTFCFVFIES